MKKKYNLKHWNIMIFWKWKVIIITSIWIYLKKKLKHYEYLKIKSLYDLLIWQRKWNVLIFERKWNILIFEKRKWKVDIFEKENDTL